MPKQFVVITSDMSPSITVSNIRSLLRDARDLLQMDIVFVSEILKGQRLVRWVDKSADTDQSVVEGQSDALKETYCQRVVDSRLPLTISDAKVLPDAEKISAANARGIRAYLAVPIVLSDGEIFGTLCCISHKPRTALGSRQIDALRLIAERVAIEIEKILPIAR